jgi:hypothetical protein
MTTHFTPPLIQTPALTFSEAHVALPWDPALLAQSACTTGPVPLSVALLDSDVRSLSAVSSAPLRLSVYPAPNGTRAVCVSTQTGGTQLRLLLRASSQATLAWVNSCHEIERMLLHVTNLETGKKLAISAPFVVPVVGDLLGVLREPSFLTDDHRRQGMAWLVRHLSLPQDLEHPSSTLVRRVLMCAEGAHELLPLIPNLGMEASFGLSSAQ